MEYSSKYGIQIHKYTIITNNVGRQTNANWPTHEGTRNAHWYQLSYDVHSGNKPHAI